MRMSLNNVGAAQRSINYTLTRTILNYHFKGFLHTKFDFLQQKRVTRYTQKLCAMNPMHY